jgi:tetratricopeptide (TPR) repeat protein
MELDEYTNYIEKGTRLLGMEMPQESLEYLIAAQRVWPKSAEALNKIGVAFAKMGNFAIAETYLRRSILNDPLYQAAHSNLGCVLYLSGNHTEALKHLRIATNTKTNRASVHYNLMVVYRSMGKVIPAMYELRKARLSEIRNLDERRSKWLNTVINMFKAGANATRTKTRLAWHRWRP